jgi:hypothetical protein
VRSGATARRAGPHASDFAQTTQYPPKPSDAWRKRRVILRATRDWRGSWKVTIPGVILAEITKWTMALRMECFARWRGFRSNLPHSLPHELDICQFRELLAIETEVAQIALMPGRSTRR